jgi:hypothetical protein
MAILTAARQGWVERRLRPAIAWLMALSLLCAAAAARPASEYQVKAAFLLNFTRFVEWPETAFADANAPFTVCILGEDPFGSVLDRLVEGQSAGGRKLEVRRLQQPPPAKTCQVLFVSREEKDAAGIVSGLGPGILTVGESDGFLRAGGMIGFVVEGHKVRFDINHRAAAKASLTLSAKLLGVARSVQK